MAMVIKIPRSDVDEFMRRCRAYWKRNIRKYFNETTLTYGLPHKMDHRFVIEPGDEGGGSSIRDAIIVTWTPSINTIHIRHGKILVQSQSAYETVKVRSHSGKRGRPGFVKIRAHDLFRLLQEGTPATPGRFVIGRNPRTGTRYGFRLPAGIRGAQSNRAWIAWMTDFIRYIDMQLEILSDKIASAIPDMLITGHELQFVIVDDTSGITQIDSLFSSMEET